MSRALTWAGVPAPVRALAFWALIVNAAGYAVALVFAYLTTHLTPDGAAVRYRGADPAAASDDVMRFPKPLAEMVLTTHTHLLGMAALFIVSGLCLALCSRPHPRLKRFLIVEPFAATLVSFACIWLMRFVDARFAWLLFLSSISMAVVFAIQVFVALGELWRLRLEP